MFLIEGQTYYRAVKLVRSHGVRGEMKIEPLTPYFNLCDFSGECWVSDRHSQLSRQTVLDIRWNGHSGFLSFSGIGDRNESDRFAGGFLLIGKDRLTAPPEGEYFVFEMIGLNVFNEDGNPVGVLSDIREGPAYDWYEVTLQETGEKRLIPAVEDFIRSVNIECKKIIIRDRPGLLKDIGTESEPNPSGKGARADD